ncbi:hypothetical protein L1887_37616 [Cichorium endivia]|nr:hypothetical protein L1887_37616 [Cichorium endivia]
MWLSQNSIYPLYHPSMAAITFFILLSLTLSSTIHARESQFFAKISNNIPKESQPLNTNQQDPNSIPQTKPDGGAYGLYGHESGQLPPSTTANDLPANLPENYNPVAYTTPIHSSTQDLPEEFNDPEAYQLTGESGMYNSEKQDMGAKFANGDNMYNYGKQDMGANGGEMYNSEKQEMGAKFANGDNMYNYGKQDMGANGGNMYNLQKQGMSDTRFMENGRYYYAGGDGYKSQKPPLDDTRFMETEDGGNTYNSQEQGSEDMYNSEKQGLGETTYSTTNNANVYNMERQGMSDTRFLENGKYYYDLNMEKKSRSFDSRNGYNTNGYNGNSYDRYNPNGGYQNHEEFQVNEENQFNP